MKYLHKKLLTLNFFSIAFMLLVPAGLYAQKGGDKNDIYIVLSCTEYIGDGKIRAHFGYQNTGKKTVVVNETGSVVTYNHGQSKKYGPYTFEPGVKEKAFSQDFDAKDRVQWTVIMSDGTSKTVDADINSNHCKNVEESLNIIPGYTPPEGGKENNSKIGAELTSLYKAFSFDPAGFTGATDDIFQLEGVRVLIEVVAGNGQFSSMISSLNMLGFDVVTENPGLKKATGWINIAYLLQLNGFDALYYARPVYPGVSNYIVPATGLTRSQGDFAMHSDFARLGFDIDGSGVKIGVLSNSYNTRRTAHIDISNGDLPGTGNPNGYTLEVDVLKDMAPTHGVLSDEGRAMLQIVHDIAPGAGLAFRTGFMGELDMADGIRELAEAQCNVIVDDISYITEPFFRDGIISKTIDSVVSEGITFFSSAGNFGNYSYAADFNGAPAPSSINGEAHDFNGLGDIFQGILLSEGSYTLVLQWDDGSDPDMATTQTDLDIFLSDDAGFSLLGFNRENIGGFPIEVVPFAVSGDSVYANVLISRSSGPDVPVKLKYILFRGGSLFRMLEYNDQGKSTIVGHPNAEKAISVGAVRYDKNQIYSPGEYTMPVIMSFSSVGGTPVDNVVRAKPDITAPNGVNTTIDLGSGDWVSPVDPDTLYPNFFGTSAASPHAAGVAALIMEAKLKFDPEQPVHPEDIRSLMKSTALDMDDPGEDLVSGAGFIQAHKALMTFANPTPYVENLILSSESGIPGESIIPFSFTVTGDFFTDSTRILFRGEPLEEGVVIEDEHTIRVEHPGFIGNPELQAYNPVISPSELDGGFSEGIYFSDPVRKKVIIKAEVVAKKYGEVLPEYSSTIHVVTAGGDTLGLEEAVLSGNVLQGEADRLSGLQYTVPAAVSSGAGAYIIIPSLSPELDMDHPTSEIDHAISEKYILEFINGSLVVEKLALRIKPADLEITYGDQLPPQGIEFLYEIGDTGVVIDNPGLILSSVEQEHTSALSNEIALVPGISLVNGIPLIRGVAVANGVKLIRGIAVVNGVEVKVEIQGNDTTVYIAGEPLTSGVALIRGIAVVNRLPFVNMTEILRGIAVVNGDEVTFEDGFMTELNGVVLENKVPATSGVAMVNGTGLTRGVAVVNGHEVVTENGITTIDGQPVPIDGIALVSGIPVIRGIAVVNSSLITRGVAVVNGIEVPIENGIPSVRGIAVVNGIPMIRGIAVVNNLEVQVIDGEISEVKENGVVINVLNSRGVAVVNGVAMVNGTQLTRGVAVVNGIAVVDEAGTGDVVVNLENMNLLASRIAIANGNIPSVRGIAVVNGLEGIDGNALKTAAGVIQPDSSVIYEEVSLVNGIAVVSGLAYVRGIAVVNGEPLTNGDGLVNGTAFSQSSNKGTLMVFDATDIGAPAEDVSFTPISFITGTTAGKHWIVPGTFLSNNFEITYGLGTLTIGQVDLTITADDKTKTYGEDDPELTYRNSGLYPGDSITGELTREGGENSGNYAILQGSLNAGENYAIHYDSAVMTIDPARLIIGATAGDKIYDGTREAVVVLSENSLPGDTLDITYTSSLFEDKHVGENKLVTVLGLSVEGKGSGNYVANEIASCTASITPRNLEIGITAMDKIYDGNTDATTSAYVAGGLVDGDDVEVSSAGGAFSTSEAGTGILVTASVSSSGVDAPNYVANFSALDTADINPREVMVSVADPFLYIKEGDPLPEFAFNYLGWIPGDTGNEGYTVLRNTDHVGYNASSSTSAGTYTVTPVPSNHNYIFEVETGTLHVNPYGPGTRAIKPVLNCIQKIANNYYVANFEYKNENDVAVYIPTGPDNLLTGSGIDWPNSGAVPTMFSPGGGSFVVFFDGSALSWTVSSREGEQKVSNAANANSSSTKCKSGQKSASVSTAVNEEEALDPDQLMVYPNPVTAKVQISMKDIEHYKMITIFDLAGRSYPFNSIEKRADHLEIDMEQLPSGQYFIRIVMDDSARIVPVIKQ